MFVPADQLLFSHPALAAAASFSQIQQIQPDLKENNRSILSQNE